MKILLILVSLLFLMPAAADYRVGDRLAPGKSAAPSQTREISWDDLMPPDWNPAKALEGLNLDQLSDDDPRAMEVLAKLRAMWDSAPPNPALAGRRIRLPGFMVPLEFGKRDVREFLLVPYFGACIHVPPPPANQIIHVVARKPVRTKTYMDAVWIEGVLELGKTSTEMGEAGYRMRAARVEPYVERKKR